MRKILLVTPCPTHPATEGNSRRVLSLITALEAMGHEVHVLYLPHFMFSAPDLAAMRARWRERLHLGEPQLRFLPEPIRIKALRVLERLRLRAFAAPGALEYDYLARPAWRRQATELVERGGFEVVIVEYVLLSRILVELPQSVLKLIDTHDRFGQRDRLIALPWRYRWFATTEDQEARGLARADAVLAIQEEEAGYFRALTQVKVATVGHLLGEVRQAGDPDGPPSVLMVGSANIINRVGLAEFLARGWPLVRAAIPQARFRLVGGICDHVSPDHDGLELLGVIDDVGQLYSNGHAVLSPMLQGTGLAIKSIEALGQGKALVTTPAGARGIADGGGTAFLVGGSAEELAAHLIGLLRDQGARESLKGAALAYAERWNRRQLAALEGVVAGEPQGWRPEAAAQTKPSAVGRIPSR
jgi:glycosyltransferase involved in cell wall biosynthesis